MITGAAVVAGVVGAPVRHSLSPLIHGAWLAAAGINGAYVPFGPPEGGFVRFADGLRGGAMRGLNVTVPFKKQALALADRADADARAAGAANLLLFGKDGSVEARNTDGLGMLEALAEQAPGWSPEAGAAVVLGAGGAAQGAAAALSVLPRARGRWPGGPEGVKPSDGAAFSVASRSLSSGRPEAGPGGSTTPPPRAGEDIELRIVNRTRDRAEALAERFGGTAYGWDELPAALDGAALVVNATTRGLNGVEPLRLPWPAPPPGAAALDMVYRPLRTAFLEDAAAAGWATVDGLAMLIAQARPSFEAFYGCPPPAAVDVRALCLAELERRARASA